MVELKEDDPTVAILRGQHGEAIYIDAEDYERVGCYLWTVKPYKQTFYASTVFRGRSFLLHRVIMRCAVGDPRIVDHEDDNGLNCTKRNMRYATHRQNTGRQRNSRLSSAGYIGVEARDQKFVARCRMDNKQVFLGRFDTAIEAARAYDAFVRVKLGKFARTNFGEGADSDAQRSDSRAGVSGGIAEGTGAGECDEGGDGDVAGEAGGSREA